MRDSLRQLNLTIVDVMNRFSPVFKFFAQIGSAIGRFLLGPVFRWMMIGLGGLGLVFTLLVSSYVYSKSLELEREAGASGRKEAFDINQLKAYKPPQTTRVLAGDGKLIAEFAEENRVYVPYEGIPDHVVQAFISAEDKSFFSHEGIDYMGMTRAGIRNAAKILQGRGGNLQGGSTITQQVAKILLLEDTSQELDRKVKEGILAKRMEKELPKEQILELYLNEIYLGGSSHGVASAALNYFNKPLTDLTIEEAAVLAAMAQRPGDVNPFLNPERSKTRRDWVIGRMYTNGYISKDEAESAKAQPLVTRERLKGEEYSAATYFVQQLRRDLENKIGEAAFKEDGLIIRTTLDTRLQLAAQNALRNGLEDFDRRKGYRGPLEQIELGDNQLEALQDVRLPGGYGTREAALVIEASEQQVKLLLTDDHEINLAADDVEWSRTYRDDDGRRGLKPGDVVMVGVERGVKTPEGADESNPAGDPLETEAGITSDDTGANVSDIDEELLEPVGEARLGQIPEVEGALLAIDPHTGRVLAMAGGYSFYKSQFNRATQAKRQPGSSFKPFVYASAMEMVDPRTGKAAYTPATQILDAPFVDCEDDRLGEDCYMPSNYTSGRFYGMSTLRLGLEKSRNAMTVRLASDVSMEHVSEFSNRIGLYEDLPPYIAMALGSGEVTLWDMAKAYSLLVNGGKKVTPTLIDRIQDRDGNTIREFRNDLGQVVYTFEGPACEWCNEEFNGQVPPLLPDNREQVIDPIIAYQTAYMLQGVVDRGTAAGLRRGCPREDPTEDSDVEVPPICFHIVGGKTGTTNDYKDAWFVGFSPDLVVAIYVGYDEPRTLGSAESGGRVAAPIFGEFMNEALLEYDVIPFRAPSGIRFVDIDARTGELPGPGTGQVIREAFRRGSEPGFDNDFDDNDFDFYTFEDDRNSGYGSTGTGSDGYTDPDAGNGVSTTTDPVDEDFDTDIY